MLSTFLNSTALVFVGEIGDKTQLLALLLATRYRKPWTILAGVLVATLLNHALAAFAGNWLASLFSPDVLRWALAASFLAFAAWVLIPDKEEEPVASGHWGAFLTTCVAFFIAEMGDKTQLATIALGAHYPNAFAVTLGTTVGMLLANALAIFLGGKLLARIPMIWIRRFAAFLFLSFGFGVLLSFNGPIF